MTINRNLSILAEGASSSGVLGTANGGTNSTPVTAIKLQFQGGNIASGKASLYGISP